MIVLHSVVILIINTMVTIKSRLLLAMMTEENSQKILVTPPTLEPCRMKITIQQECMIHIALPGAQPNLWECQGVVRNQDIPICLLSRSTDLLRKK